MVLHFLRSLRFTYVIVPVLSEEFFENMFFKFFYRDFSEKNKKTGKNLAFFDI